MAFILIKIRRKVSIYKLLQSFCRFNKNGLSLAINQEKDRNNIKKYKYEF